jgi:hypothetical protein
MLPEIHHLVLEKLLTRLNREEITWALTGSACFALQGFNFVVNDIDLQTDKLGSYPIEQCFYNHVIEPVIFSSGDKKRSYFGALMSDGVRVEIMGDFQKRLPNGEWESPVDVESLREFHERLYHAYCICST